MAEVVEKIQNVHIYYIGNPAAEEMQDRARVHSRRLRASDRERRVQGDDMFFARFSLAYNTRKEWPFLWRLNSYYISVSVYIYIIIVIEMDFDHVRS